MGADRGNGNAARRGRGGRLRAMRRGSLKNVVAGVLGSFVSRNNDVGGYWAIGLLYALARSAAAPDLVVDLMTGSMVPAAVEFESMVGRYRADLEKRLTACGVELRHVAKAEVRITFDAAVEPGYRGSSLPASPFRCEVQLTDDRGRSYVASHVGAARPHDAGKETRSLRGERGPGVNG